MIEPEIRKQAVTVRIESKARFLLMFMALLLSLPLFYGKFFTDHTARSKRENRTLAPVPQVNLFERPREYFSALDLYLEDHMGCISEASLLHQKMLFYGFRDSPALNLTVGKNGFVFLNAHDRQKKFANFKRLCVEKGNPDIASRFVRPIREIEKYYTTKGYRVVFGTPVSKPVLYPEMLPASVPDDVKQSCVNFRNENVFFLLRNILQKEGVNFYYPFELFFANRDTPYFYPKENFHWNGKSAHLFVEKLLLLLEIDVDEEYNKESEVVSGTADLGSIVGFRRKIDVWHYPYTSFDVNPMQQVLAKKLRKYFKNASDFSFFRTANAMTERRALIISNSFGAFVVPHIAPAYKELAHVALYRLQEHEKKNFFSSFVDSFAPDDIIFIIHDDAMYMYSDIALYLDGEN